MSLSIQLPKWYDLHAHFRQGGNIAAYLTDHLAMGCAGALAMPNTKPPISRIQGRNDESAMAWSIEGYRRTLLDHGANAFEKLIIPLYLTRDTSPADIESGVRLGLLEAAKYYPPHGTTNSDYGVPIEEWIGSDVLKAMEIHGVILCLHGERHGLSGSDYFDEASSAETCFYREWMPRLREAHPGLKLVCEHITTETAVQFVEESEGNGQVGATVTPQHLLFTVGHLLQGFKYHLYCLPLVKFLRDREVLRKAVTREGQTRFFAGTDSAPHTVKATDCGCAAGCYTGGCAPQLYAMAFEDTGLDLGEEKARAALEAFLCRNGPLFYGFPPSTNHFILHRNPSAWPETWGEDGEVISLPQGMNLPLTWEILM